jgi:hypothetical protein
MNMNLGEALKIFNRDEIEQPHLTPASITVTECGKLIARGKASEIIDVLADRSDRKILKWDAYFHDVNLEI